MRRHATRLPLLLACAALFPAACVTHRDRAPHSGIASLWNEYRQLSPERALALAGDPDRRWVGAIAGGQASQAEAEQSALAECQKRRLERRMRAPCRLYATGEEIVW